MATGGEDFRKYAPPDEPPYLLGDGVDVWTTLSTGAPSPRDWLLLETHPAPHTVHGDALIVGDMKIYRRGPTFPDVENGWFPPPGQDPLLTPYTLKCGAPQPPSQPNKTACLNTWCLWNVTHDPCEFFDLADEHPDIVKSLVERLKTFSATAVPPEAGSGCAMQRVPVGDSVSFMPCDWKPPAA